MINPHQVSDAINEWIVVASLVHNMLPPWDLLEAHPKLQRAYKFVVYTVGYMALNARSTVQRSISINNPRGHNRCPKCGFEDQQAGGQEP